MTRCFPDPGAAWALIPLFVLASAARADEDPTYERDLKPLLAKHCTICHNARKLEKLDTSGGLALDSYDAVLRGTKEHAVVTPQKSAASELYRRVCETDEDRRMPLYDDPLDRHQLDLVRRWIDAGAPRGTPAAPVAAAATATTAPPTRRRATAPVTLPIEEKAPEGIEGLGPGGKIELEVPVGPLPATSALAFRADGRQLAVGTYGQVSLWDLPDARVAATLGPISGQVHALAFSPDGRRLAVGTGLPAENGSIRVYTIPDGTLALDLEGHSDVIYALAFRADGGQLASAGFDQTVRLWDLPDGKPAGVFRGHSDFVYDLAYAPDRRTLLSVSKDRSVKRFDAHTLRGLRTYSDHDEDVLALAIRPDGSSFVSAGNEPQLRWWTPEGEKPSKKTGGHTGPVHQLAFSADGRRLISASGDKTVRLWDGATGIFQRTLAGTTEWQYAAALSPDAHLAAAGGWDGLVHLWNADTGALFATLLQPPSPSPALASWLALTPQGYVAASTELLQQLHWRVGKTQVDGERMQELFANPERVMLTIQGKDVEGPFNKKE